MGFKYILSRVGVMLPVFFLVVTGVFFMIRFAPGGPFDEDRKVTPEVMANLNAKYHLDEPLVKQYYRYLSDLVRLDLGPSYKHADRSVNEIISEALPISIELGLYSLFWSLLIGVTAGSLASIRPNTLLDYIPMSVSVIGICMPTFVIGPVMLLVFGLWLGWFPISGWDSWDSKVLPSLTLGFAYAAYISRLTRGGLMEIKYQDFIRTAKAKGLSERAILLKHSLRGGLLPVVSYMGPTFAGMISGALVTETIFNIPGLGRFFIQAALGRDYTLVMGTALLFFTLVFVSNLLVDIAYVFMDPRVKYE